jgi:uncharacterized protein (TIGR00645 family)
MTQKIRKKPRLSRMGQLVFLSRWLQAPLYFGLIVAQGIYVYEFIKKLIQLLLSAPQLDETQIMLAVLGLIDVVMIANLLVMVIVGGYEVFVSRLCLEGHPDEPEWLDHVNAGTMKIKLAVSLIGISSIHLLQTFINPLKQSNEVVMWQVIIHLTFVVSALFMAWTNRLMDKEHKPKLKVAEKQQPSEISAEPG